MLVREEAERNETLDRRLAAILAGIAGALNAAAFYAIGFFSANMTGNVSFVSDHIALGQWGSALVYLAVVLVFILGAMLSTVLIHAGRRRGMPRVYAYTIALEALLLAALGVADLWLLDRWRIPVLVPALAFLLGLQNAVVTRISGARVRTTHVSGMVTDIGIELATELDRLRGHANGNEAAQNRSKLRLHVTTVTSFLLGGVAGVAIYRAAGGYLLLLAAAALGLLALTGAGRTRQVAVS
jgi:uncharacterized membrane protein YoaK (UPF0700 family)